MHCLKLVESMFFLLLEIVHIMAIRQSQMQFVTVSAVNFRFPVDSSDVMQRYANGLANGCDGRCTCAERYSRRVHITARAEYGMWKDMHIQIAINFQSSLDLDTFLLYFPQDFLTHLGIQDLFPFPLFYRICS